ncbi:MAG: hypothetical protein QOD99_1454, partial [Chthoniobacter sp.]|nr:hypothetical protein [Chthoniobacter sp.]
QNLLAENFVNEATITEINSRSDHIRSFFCRDFLPTTSPEGWRAQDEQLGKVYSECMGRLNSGQQHLLREAERAWIIYRDADELSARTVYTDSAVWLAAVSHLTANRMTQLSAISNSLGTSSHAENSESPVTNRTPDPSDVKTVADLKDQSKSVLLSLKEKSGNLFIAQATALKNAPDLPPTIADQLSDLDLKFRTILTKDGATKFLASASSEYLTVELLSSWSLFKRQLKTGDVADARKALAAVLGRKPKDLPPAYDVMWAFAEAWLQAYDKVAPDFESHLKKAKSFAELGKNADAIREYQAAFDIIDNSSIPPEIKKLREQSLGL